MDSIRAFNFKINKNKKKQQNNLRFTVGQVSLICGRNLSFPERFSVCRIDSTKIYFYVRVHKGVHLPPTSIGVCPIKLGIGGHRRLHRKKLSSFIFMGVGLKCKRHKYSSNAINGSPD